MARLTGVLTDVLGALVRTDNLTGESIAGIQTSVKALVANFEVELDRVNHFKFDPKWKTRVINVPKAIDAMKRLIGLLRSGITPKLRTLEQPFITFQTGLHDIELTSQAALNDPQAPSKFAVGLSEAKEFIEALNQLVGDVDKALQAVSELTAVFDRVLQFLQTLDDIFLKQGNTRKVVKRTTTIRVGKLHSS